MLHCCIDTNLFIWATRPVNTLTFIYTFLFYAQHMLPLSQWNKGLEDNQKAINIWRQLSTSEWFMSDRSSWFASPPASQRLACCCEAEVLLAVWLEWRGAAAHEKRASVTLSLSGTLPNCWRGVEVGMLPRRGVCWALWWWIIVPLCSLPLPLLSLSLSHTHPPPHPITNTVIIRLWRVGHLQ